MTSNTIQGTDRNIYQVVRVTTSAWKTDDVVRDVLFETHNLYEAYQRLLQEEADHPTELYYGSPFQFKWVIDVRLAGTVREVVINGELH